MLGEIYESACRVWHEKLYFSEPLSVTSVELIVLVSGIVYEICGFRCGLGLAALQRHYYKPTLVALCVSEHIIYLVCDPVAVLYQPDSIAVRQISNNWARRNGA